MIHTHAVPSFLPCSLRVFDACHGFCREIALFLALPPPLPPYQIAFTIKPAPPHPTTSFDSPRNWHEWKKYTIRTIRALISWKNCHISRKFISNCLLYVHIYIYGENKFGVQISVSEVLASTGLSWYTERYLPVNFGTAPVSSNVQNGALLL